MLHEQTDRQTDGRLTIAIPPFALRASSGKNQLRHTGLRTKKHNTSYWVILEQSHNINSITLRQCSCSLQEASRPTPSVSRSRVRSPQCHRTVSHGLTEEGSDSELLHSDEHCYFVWAWWLSVIRAWLLQSWTPWQWQCWCALAGRLAAMPAFQTPSTLCHVYTL